MKVRITCLGENSLGWFTRVQNLALSLRRVEGPLSDAEMVANFVSDVEPDFTAKLAQLGVAVRVVEPMPGDLGPANKLRMFELGDDGEFDVLVALDCDIVIVKDFLEWVPSAAVGAKAADFDRLKIRDWHKLCKVAKLDAHREERLRATTTGRLIPPYFNSGVVTVPRDLCADLRIAWTESYEWLRARLRDDPHLLPRHLHWFADQVSLAMAIPAAGLPYVELPVGMNYPTHVSTRQTVTVADVEPSILHYHSDIDAGGFLIPPTDGPARAQVERFNHQRAAYLDAPYMTVPSPRLSQRLTRMQQTIRGSTRRRRHRLRTWVHDLGGPRRRDVVPLRPGRRKQ